MNIVKKWLLLRRAKKLRDAWLKRIETAHEVAEQLSILLDGQK